MNLNKTLEIRAQSHFGVRGDKSKIIRPMLRRIHF
jgi:hypothetical protein